MNNLKQRIDFKEGINNLDLLYIHPQLMIVLAFISNFCHQNNINFQLTSIIRSEERNKKFGSVSKTHVEGRAFDFSILPKHGWTPELLGDLVTELDKNFANIAAISSSDHLPKIIVIHDNGNGAHAHVQIRRNL